MFIPGSKKNTSVRSSRNARRGRRAGTPSTALTIRRPVSFLPGVVPKTKATIKRHANTSVKNTYATRAKSHRGSNTTPSNSRWLSAVEAGSEVELEVTSIGVVASQFHSNTVQIMKAVKNAEPSTAKAAIRSPIGAGSYPTSDRSFASSTASPSSATCHGVSHSALKRLSKEPEIVPS